MPSFKSDVAIAFQQLTMGKATADQQRMISEILQSHVVPADVPSTQQLELFATFDYPMVLSMSMPEGGDDSHIVNATISKIREAAREWGGTIELADHHSKLSKMVADSGSREQELLLANRKDGRVSEMEVQKVLGAKEAGVAVTESKPPKGIEIEEGSLPNYHMSWKTFVSYLDTLIAGMHDDHARTFQLAHDEVRYAFTACLWNKEGVVNLDFAYKLYRYHSDIVIQFEPSHDITVQEAKVYIPNCEEMVIIGKKGSC